MLPIHEMRSFALSRVPAVMCHHRLKATGPIYPGLKSFNTVSPNQTFLLLNLLAPLLVVGYDLQSYPVIKQGTMGLGLGT